MADLTFNNQNLRSQSLRAAPSKYIRSKIRYNFEQSDGQRVAEVFYPNKYVPVQFMENFTEDWVVIPKGKVVAAIGYGEQIAYGASATDGTLGAPNTSGVIPVYTNRAGQVVTSYMDSDFWGYDQSVNGLLVPANGGVDRTSGTYFYRGQDVTAGTYANSTSLAAANQGITGAHASGNIPVGAAMYDIYQDIRGKNLNYQQWDKWGIVCDYYVTVPFIREGNSSVFNSNMSSASTSDSLAPLEALRNQVFLTIPSGCNPRTGGMIIPDARGNYVMQANYTAAAELTGATAASSPNIQTVAKLVVLDCRFPKDMLQYVDTYEGSQMAGTDTGGLPYWLFIFAYNYLTAATGTAPAISTILDYVKSGRFGMARMQLHVKF